MKSHHTVFSTVQFAESPSSEKEPPPPSMASDAAHLLLLLVMAAALAVRSDGAWCLCREDLPDSALQKTLDYACCSGADCNPVLQKGACFTPDSVKSHCSYAVNSFYQINNQNSQACLFAGTAALSNTDPSSNGCQYPASTSAARAGGGGGAGMDSPPGEFAQGPSSYDDKGCAGIPPAAKETVILACCSLLALFFRV